MSQLVTNMQYECLFFYMKSIFREKLATSVALTKANGANATSSTTQGNRYVSPVVVALFHDRVTYIIYGCLTFIMFSMGYHIP